MANAPRKRFYDTVPSPSNMRAIWDRLHDLDDLLTAANQTIAAQAGTITTMQEDLRSTTQRATEALITAGKATSATATTNTGGGGGEPPPTTVDTHPNYIGQVQAAKDDLTTEAADLTGACGAFRIIERAVSYIRASDPTAGYLHKPSGTQCQGFSTDIICFNNGAVYDVLIDGGGLNTPMWDFKGFTDPALWRQP